MKTNNSKTGYELAIAAVAVILLLAIGSMSSAKNVSVKFPNSGVSLKAEVADTPYMLGRGLMFRQKMFLDSGMLFVFSQQQILKFWMKNTLMPLDMIFISENFTIVNIVEDAKPCTSNCEIYSSIAPAKYTVEANAGFVRNNGIKVGDEVRVG
ncbi:MAG: DUF192 domain-containing protein [Candidatus Aenigmatarchaeota archaeon]